jgi:hypothetical protein
VSTVLRDLAAAIDKTLAFEGDLDVVEVCRLAERVEFLKLRTLHNFDRGETWRDEHFLNAGAALREKCRMTEGRARHHLEVARKLESLPAVGAAFATGDLSRQHVDVIAKAYTPERANALEHEVPRLIAAATRMHPRELAAIVQEITDRIDDDDGGSSDEARYARRRMTGAIGIDQMIRTETLSDPDSGEIILIALDAEMERDRVKGDARTRDQRRHDAFVNICRRALDNGELGSSRTALPHISFVVDLEKLDDPGGLFEGARAEAAKTGRVSRATLQRISCDCTVSRVIMNGPSVVVDVGRSTHTLPVGTWRALVARDRHCQHPGCRRPPGMCEGHHIIYWEHGGPTDLSNLKLLCWQHHRAAHAHDPPRQRRE